MKIYKLLTLLLLIMSFGSPLFAQEFQPHMLAYSSGYSKSPDGSQNFKMFSSIGLPITGNSGNSTIQVNSGKIYPIEFFSILDKIVAEERNEQNFPNEFKLYTNYPNPFNSSTRIKYEIPVQTYVDISLFDVLGSEVQTILSEEKPAGVFEIEFNPANLPSGIYFFRIKAGEFLKIGKMMLLK